MTRIDGRSPLQLRPVHLVVDYLDYAEGSVLVEAQGTGEGGVFSRSTMDNLIGLAEQGITELLALQRLFL
jgi:ribonuclease PH